MAFRLVELEFFVSLCHSVQAGHESWKEVTSWFVENPLLMEGRKKSSKTPFPKWVDRLDEHFQRPLVNRPGGSPKSLTPAGEQIFRLTSPLIPQLQLMWQHPDLASTPVLTLGTANVFEIHLIAAKIVNAWHDWPPAQAKERQLVHLHVKEAKSRFEGLDNVETGAWQVFIDGVHDVADVTGNLKAVPLGAELGLMVVVPIAILDAERKKKRKSPLLGKLEAKQGVTLKELWDVPLCFVDVMGLGDRLAAASHRQTRIALASNEAAKVVAAQGRFVTICAGWTKTLPSDYLDSDKYCVVPLLEPRCVVQVAAIVRIEPPPSDLVNQFVEWVARHVQAEAVEKDVRGVRTGILPVPSQPAEEVVAKSEKSRRTTRRNRSSPRRQSK